MLSYGRLAAECRTSAHSGRRTNGFVLTGISNAGVVVGISCRDLLTDETPAGAFIYEHGRMSEPGWPD